jgi:DnaK suppressor protein
MLTSDQIRALEKLLLAQESALRAKMHKAIRERLGVGATEPAAGAGIAAAPPPGGSLQGLDTAVLAYGTDALQAIESSRERMRNSTYDRCLVCNGEIGFERLLILPTAERCLACQEEHECAAPGGPQAAK